MCYGETWIPTVGWSLFSKCNLSTRRQHGQHAVWGEMKIFWLYLLIMMWPCKPLNSLQETMVMFSLHCQVYLGKITCYLILTRPVVIKFELLKQSQKNSHSSKIMIVNIIEASETEAGLGWKLFSYVGNSTLIILTYSSDLGHCFTMIVV